MNNLIINAQQALSGRRDAAVHIATRSAERNGKAGVEFTVQDNGPGFAPELIERVFEPYVSTRAEGSGLGLAIVRRIVEEHDGMVEAANTAGGGAELTIWLPAMRAVPVAMEAAS
jgi:nitrogen fixation/metabolism regulation signal transduction histidine kinase